MKMTRMPRPWLMLVLTMPHLRRTFRPFDIGFVPCGHVAGHAAISTFQPSLALEQTRRYSRRRLDSYDDARAKLLGGSQAEADLDYRCFHAAFSLMPISVQSRYHFL